MLAYINKPWTYVSYTYPKLSTATMADKRHADGVDLLMVVVSSVVLSHSTSSSPQRDSRISWHNTVVVLKQLSTHQLPATPPCPKILSLLIFVWCLHYTSDLFYKQMSYQKKTSHLHANVILKKELPAIFMSNKRQKMEMNSWRFIYSQKRMGFFVENLLVKLLNFIWM